MPVCASTRSVNGNGLCAGGASSTDHASRPRHSVASAGPVFAHGDVVPQPVDTAGLEKLGDKWRDSNPYRGNPRAIEIGSPRASRSPAKIAIDSRKLATGPAALITARCQRGLKW